MSGTADLLSEYLRDVLYRPYDASLDPSALDKEYRQLGEGLITLAKYLHEQRELAWALSQGELNTLSPPPENELAAPLKALQASLRHVSWQSLQVSKGDYRQRIDFMGEFADAFNSMVEQLDLRQQALEREVRLSREKTKALEQLNSLLTSVAYDLPQMILVFGENSHEILYSNKAASEALASDSALRGRLQTHAELLADGASGNYDARLSYDDGKELRRLSIHVYSLHWSGQNARAIVLSDKADGAERLKELEVRAYQDNQTRLNNRYYGMRILNRWLEEKKHFSLCFADLDNLKYVNDTFGHQEGDVYIMNAARCFFEFFPDCVACRIGGDEFMVLAQGFRFADVETRMQALCRRLFESGAEKPYGSRISYGIVEAEPNLAMTAGELLRLADERMYAFKRMFKKTAE